MIGRRSAAAMLVRGAAIASSVQASERVPTPTRFVANFTPGRCTGVYDLTLIQWAPPQHSFTTIHPKTLAHGLASSFDRQSSLQPLHHARRQPPSLSNANISCSAGTSTISP